MLQIRKATLQRTKFSSIALGMLSEVEAFKWEPSAARDLIPEALQHAEIIQKAQDNNPLGFQIAQSRSCLCTVCLKDGA